jgi:AcrR family transcriptional regulator
MDAKVIREQAIREAKTGLILNAARKVFSDRSFYEARLEDIAIAAGFSKAALYSYYADKEEIFLSLAIRDIEKLCDTLADVVNPGASFLANLEGMLKATFAFFGENFALLLSVANFQCACNFNREKISENHRRLLEALPVKFHRLLDLQIVLIAAARKRGEITSPIADQQLANYLSALVRGILFQWKLSGKMGDAAQEIRQLLAFMANGLGCPAADASTAITEHS